MTEIGESETLRLDRPLQLGSAVESDALNRRLFADRVTDVLERVTPRAGLVVAVEGAWGSGKTSLLAMVEELLDAIPKGKKPLVVHFNPWLIGDRDALLRQFLASIARAVKLTEHAKEGKRVAKELKTYSKAFDVLKLIPGAEPWASIVKSVVEAVGSAGEAVFDYKTPDIETHKDDLSRALKKFPTRIVVLVDDLDRLYPAEVYEMVRIIKAVGDLPNIGYVLAWDEKYVSAALGKLDVPYAEAYLDKVVQVRLPVPPLSFSQRVAQMNKGLDRLPIEAKQAFFSNGDDRHAMVFFHGLSELMEYPRDVVRLFDVVTSIEKDLRGEIHLADIIGLAGLMTKAPSVFELLRRTPQAFVGRRPGAKAAFRKAEEVVQSFSQERSAAIESCHNPKAVHELVKQLFPQTVPAEEAGFQSVEFTEGHLAHPDRLLIALQLSAHPSDVSLVQVRQFLFQPHLRDSVGASLDIESCSHFLSYLLTSIQALGADVGLDSDALAVSLARLVEAPTFVKRARQRRDVFTSQPERVAMRTVQLIAERLEPNVAQALLVRVVCDKVGLSVAADFAIDAFFERDRRPEEGIRLVAPKEVKQRVLVEFSQNVQSAAASGELFEKVDPGGILRVVARLAPARCKAIFRAMQSSDATLDNFAEALMRSSFDSHKGQVYAVRDNPHALESFVEIDKLKQHALERLKDEGLSYPARAAWRALAEGKAIYGVDGSIAKD